MADLLLVAERVSPEIAMVYADGEVDLSTRGQLRSCLHSLTASKIVLDLERVTFMDSTGTDVIVTVHKRLRTQDGGIRLRKPNELIAKTLDICGLRPLISN